VIGLGLVTELTTFARPDIGFLLYAAGRVLDGARLYVDVVEINPPLIIGLNTVPVALARALELSPITVYRLLFALALLAALLITAALVRRVLPELRARHAFLLMLGFTVFPLAGQDFGQREHLLLAFTLSYVLLTLGRASGSQVRRPTAAVIGLMAGLGLALKPHFLPLWAGLELYLLSRTRQWTSLLRLESIVAVVVLVAYGAFVPLAFPEYVRLVSLVGAAYSRFLYEPFGRLLLSGPGALVALFAILAYLALRRQARNPELWHVLAIATAAFLVGGAAQQKGLSYHFYPSFATALLLLGTIVVDATRASSSLAGRLYRAVAFALVVTSVVVVLLADVRHIGGSRFGRHSDDSFAELVEFVRARAAGERIFVFSYHIGSAFPLVNYSGTTLASRFPQLWILPASYLDELHADRPLRYRNPREMGPVERYMYAAVRTDLEVNRPKLLLVLRNARDDAINGLRRLDYLAYFGRDPRVRRVFDRYQSVGVIGEFAIYQRVAEGQWPTAPVPEATLGVLDAVRITETGLGWLAATRELAVSLLVFIVSLAWFARDERCRADQARPGGTRTDSAPAT
jgi:hypothetical protein